MSVVASLQDGPKMIRTAHYSHHGVISSPWGSPGPVTGFWWIECGKSDETTLLRLDYKRLTSDLLAPLCLSLWLFWLPCSDKASCPLWSVLRRGACGRGSRVAFSQQPVNNSPTPDKEHCQHPLQWAWKLIPAQASTEMTGVLTSTLEPWERPWARGSLEALPRVLTRM